MNKLGDAMQIKLAHDICAVLPNGSTANPKTMTNLFAALTNA